MYYPHPLALLAIGAVSAFLAKKRGKNPFLWFFLGMLFGIFGLIFLFFSQPTKAHRAPAEGLKSDPNTIDITPNVSADAKKTFWYYLGAENAQKGPMSFEGILREFREGLISRDTLVWNETLENWQPLRDFL